MAARRSPGVGGAVADRGAPQLRVGNRWAELHPATAETGREEWGNAGRLECDEAVGGAGTSLLAAFSAEPFAAALGISTASALNLISAALDLRHRLPHIWRLVEALEVPAWKAKLVSRRTHSLSAEAAAYVDAGLAPILAARGAPTIERVVAEAIARFHPDELAAAERVGRAAWDVRVQHPGPDALAGTSWLEACADTLDLTKFADVVADVARRLGHAGDPDPLEQRRAKALGIVADVHAGADLDQLIAALTAGARGGAAVDVEPASGPKVRTHDLQIYVHLNADDLVGGVAAVEHLGPTTTARLEAWLARHTAAGGRVRVTPTVDQTRTDAVDRHGPPPWMAEQVRLRDPRCVFPFCQTHARDCDLDHITPYDDTGPPGQTHPANLAPLCRRHHRAKTAGRWRYRRNDDDSYAWTSPHADRFLVSGTGTLAVTDH